MAERERKEGREKLVKVRGRRDREIYSAKKS
jgi:hypothetical protein